MLTVIAVLLGLVVGGAATAIGLRVASGTRVHQAEEARAQLLADAAREAEAIRREAQIEERERVLKLRAELETELQERRGQIVKLEQRSFGAESIERALEGLEPEQVRVARLVDVRGPGAGTFRYLARRGFDADTIGFLVASEPGIELG